MKELTVIIPCLNEEKFIEKTLKSIINSDFDKDKLEVLIYDGNSEDRSTEIIKDYEEKFDYINLRINNERIAPVAFNEGIKEANTEFVMILGAHSEVATNYFTKCVDFLQNNKNYDVVGGVLKNKGVDKVSDSIATAMSSPFGVGGAHFRTGRKSGDVDTVAFGVYRKSIFKKVGLFNEKLIRGQDGEMNFRIVKNDGKIYLLNTTYAEYYVRSSFKKLFKQYFQYGYWKFKLNVINKTFISLRQIVPSLFILLILLTIISGFYFKSVFILCLSFIILYFILGIYQSLRLAASLITRFHILLSFIVLHISYGLGYFAGLGAVLLNKRVFK
ncbi:MAG: glycosyltransferase family 2 protein [Bacteroidetes bacterium]|nr:glycosyltransferase family 2 protein [Bacteroidota bacterium]